MTEKRNTIPGVFMKDLPKALQEQANEQVMTGVNAGESADNQANIFGDTNYEAIDIGQIAKQELESVTEKPADTEKHGIKYFIKDVLSVVISAVVIAVVLKSFVIDSRIVPTGSMKPTIIEGDRVIILKLPYLFGAVLEHQDVVVFAAGEEFGSDEDLLKRVIGLPGDTVEVKDGLVYVNGSALYEPYILEPPYKNFEMVTVPEGCYFMMGDNRNHSRDSTMWIDPFVPSSAIKGKVLLCYWPVTHWGLVK
ncbi:MAG: signal peptidase I [Firmicutes bacterium]|nr:signal peptidase I [Bacillota bacterium]